MKPTLLIMAAGMGSRYGGLKQIDPVGPNGEIIIDYSIYDAIHSGFGKLVFVIRHYFEDAFKEKIGNKFDSILKTAYAYQELDVCLDRFKLPLDREKPCGTGHAVLVAKHVIDEPFAVINADDYYGQNSLKVIADYLSVCDSFHDSNYAMVSYILRNTLSEYGHVSRGLCECNEHMFLKKIVERTKIENVGGALYFYEAEKKHLLTGDEIASMNLWGFQTSIFDHLQVQFSYFLDKYGHDREAEYFISTVVDNLIKNGQCSVKVLPSCDSWFGITYREDKVIATKIINKLIEEGIYPERLWQ